MPVPIILGTIAVGSALYGAYKGTKGAIDHNNASNINDEAKSLVDTANRKVESQRTATNEVLTDYGERKLRAFNGTISDFIETFGRLKNVELIQTPELEKLNLGDFSSQTLAGLRQDYQALKDAGLGLGAGLGGGAALAFGAYNGTMLLAAARSDFKVTARPAAVALGALTMAGRNNQDVMAR